MIKKSFAIAIVLLILHGMLVRYRPKWNFAEHQWQENIVKAQHFIYKDTIVENVIVGSSLSWHLVADSLPSIYNFSFGGGGILDGLAILKNNNKLPKNIYIEMNVASRGETKKFTENLNSPLLYTLRKQFPQFREGYQPVNILSNAIITHSIIKRTLQKIKTIFDFDAFSEEKNQKLRAQDLTLQTTGNTKPTRPEILSARFESLKEYVSYFEKKGTKVVFFEMPVDKQLSLLPDAISIRERFYKNFPPDEYGYIAMPDCAQYPTGDGYHLGLESAKKYSAYLKKEIDKLKN